jgi:hypothetical protein
MRSRGLAMINFDNLTFVVGLTLIVAVTAAFTLALWRSRTSNEKPADLAKAWWKKLWDAFWGL